MREELSCPSQGPEQLTGACLEDPVQRRSHLDWWKVSRGQSRFAVSNASLAHRTATFTPYPLSSVGFILNSHMAAWHMAGSGDLRLTLPSFQAVGENSWICLCFRMARGKRNANTLCSWVWLLFSWQSL